MRAQNPLEINAQCGRNDQAEKLLTQRPGPNQSDPVEGGSSNG
jgi:hypothetical protein